MTIRRDLNILQENGYIIRTNGGAKLCENSLTDFFYYNTRRVSSIDLKRQIAVKALDLIENCDSIYLDASTTVLELAHLLPDQRLFVTTNMPTIAVALLNMKNIEVLLTGGSLNKSVVSLSGPVSLNSLNMINIDRAFIGAAGFSLEHGFTNALYNECELKKKVIASAKSIAILIDSTKIGKSLPYTFALPENVDEIITDKPLPPEMTEKLSELGVTVIC